MRALASMVEGASPLTLRFGSGKIANAGAPPTILPLVSLASDGPPSPQRGPRRASATGCPSRGRMIHRRLTIGVPRFLL